MASTVMTAGQNLRHGLTYLQGRLGNVGEHGILVSIAVCATRVNRDYERVAHGQVQPTDVVSNI